jgi:hypothetical protein
LSLTTQGADRGRRVALSIGQRARLHRRETLERIHGADIDVVRVRETGLEPEQLLWRVGRHAWLEQNRAHLL